SVCVRSTTRTALLAIAAANCVITVAPDIIYSPKRRLRSTPDTGSGISLHGGNPGPPMSALGQKRTSEHVQSMSALPPKADIGSERQHRDTRLCVRILRGAPERCRSTFLFSEVVTRVKPGVAARKIRKNL